MPSLWLLLSLHFSIANLVVSSVPPDELNRWETVFNQRSDTDWASLWHTERHRRCFRDLEAHMKWVCMKDIYRVRDRRDETFAIDSLSDSSFVTPEEAHGMLTKVPRRQKRGIIDECCNGPHGCSWEEYAEYCTHNNRIRVKL